MIFASDLDRTMIYSPKFVEEDMKEEVIVAETKEGQVISYMSKKAFERLAEISRKLMFIPVTTRTIEQYKRISLLREIPHEYAIVSNGGNIIKDGKIDSKWETIVRERMSRECISMEDAMESFKKMSSPSWVKRTRIADGLFFYSIVERQILPMDEITQFAAEMEVRGWRMVHHSSKLYFIPKCVSKGEALLHLANRIGGTRDIISSGDSVLDIDMAGVSKSFISPLHAEIYKNMRGMADELNIRFTRENGIKSAEEILKIVKSEFLDG